MNLSQDELLSQLRGMDEYEFEELVADVWEQKGWETAVTTGSSDRGIDVIAEKSSPFNQKYVIQAKRYSADNKVGGPDIRNYEALKRQEDSVDAVVIVTTSSFSSQARQIANDLNVKLVDGEDLCDMTLQLNFQDFLPSYFNTNTLMGGQGANSSSATTKSSTTSRTPRKSNSAEELPNSPKWFRKNSQTLIFGSSCPICGSKQNMYEGTWVDNTSVENKEAIFCTSCETTWVKKTKTSGLIFKSTSTFWETDDGIKKTMSEWKEKGGGG